MNKITTLLAAGLLSAFAVGCGSAMVGGTGGSGSGNSGGGSGGTSGDCSSKTTIKAKEANDYKFSSTLSLVATPVKPNTELSFDWGDMTKDFLKHDFNGKNDVKMIMMTLWHSNLNDLQVKLNQGMPGNPTGVPLTYITKSGDSSAKLFTFTVGGGEPVASGDILARLDPANFPPDEYTYTLLAKADSDVSPANIHMIQAFKLDPSSDNTSVKMDNNSTGLTYDANLHSLQTTNIPANKSCVTVDWTDLATDALGVEFDNTSITSVLVGHYKESPSDLETKFLDLELIAQDLYKGDVQAGSSIDLGSLKTDGGKSFPGINSDGTWLVALHCGNCQNPAPLYLTVLKPQ